jgi:hypothetical protein
MFSDACEKAAMFTRPVIVSTRSVDGTVDAVCGSFVILNDQGWVVTAGHLFDSFVKHQNDLRKIKEVDEVNAGRKPLSKAPMEKDPTWLVNHSFWWGRDGTRLVDVYVNRQVDLAVGRLEPFDAAGVGHYPAFRDPGTMRPGTSLCRLGFPFSKVESDYLEEQNAFRIKKGVLPLSLFPNDGIHTRNVMNGVSKDGGYDLLYVETSSPGLRGQSGGPIFDRDCNLYALQVQTAHYPLGFQPTVEDNGRQVTENQFLNVGLGVHAKTMMSILDDRGVRYRVDREESGYRIIG